LVDIIPFLIIMTTVIFVFAFSFFIIAQNQFGFDLNESQQKKANEESDFLPYHTVSGSIWFMLAIFLGQPESTDSFNRGESTMSEYLYFIYFVSSCVIVIVMLNMLIAIMGDTFSNRKEFGRQITVKDHLGYVIDNWYLISNSFENKKKIKYLITAFSSDDIVGDKQILNQLHDEICHLKNKIKIEKEGHQL